MFVFADIFLQYCKPMDSEDRRWLIGFAVPRSGCLRLIDIIEEVVLLQIPELINSLLNYMLPHTGDGNNDELLLLMEKPWDPVGTSVYRYVSVWVAILTCNVSLWKPKPPTFFSPAEFLLE